jgi:hypothetical protein
MRAKAHNMTLADLHAGKIAWIPKDSFLAECSTVTLGVRMRVLMEYYRGLIAAGVFEENEDGSLFRSKEAMRVFEQEKTNDKPQ